MLEGWRNLRLLFPGAKLIDSSLEAFTAEAWKVRGKMDAVTAELGDTWIRGTAADPTKQRRYREVARRLASAIANGSVALTDSRVQAAYQQLIKLPEHTYGSNDGLVGGLPWDNKYMDAHINDSSYARTNSGWSDQRAYIDRAVAALGSLPLRAEIEEALAASEPAPIDGLNPPPAHTDAAGAGADAGPGGGGGGLKVWKLGADGAPVGTLNCNGVTMAFDATGAISSLLQQQAATDPAGGGGGGGGRQWADANHTLARFRYRTHSEGEFDDYGNRYMLPGCRANETNGGLCGFGKQGLTTVAGAANKDWAPKLLAAWKAEPAPLSGHALEGEQEQEQGGCRAVLQYTFDSAAQSKYGAPSIANTTITLAPPPSSPTSSAPVPAAGAAAAAGGGGGGVLQRLQIDVQYHKRQTRMAESLWLSFQPLLHQEDNQSKDSSQAAAAAAAGPGGGGGSGWRLDKLGMSIDPFDVVVNGSRAMHAIWRGIQYYDHQTHTPPAAAAPAPAAATAATAEAEASAAGAAAAVAVAQAPVLEVVSLDAPVVAIDAPSPIVFLREEQIEGKSWHFNLFNNAWNVNYPVWEINQSERFRFELLLRN